MLLRSGLALLLASLPALADAPPDYGKPGPAEVEVKTFDWKDSKRDREVPVKVYYPKSGKGPFSVVLFSHGLGGTRDGYEYLGRHWASHGLVSVHLQHRGSDDSAWRGSKRPLEDLRKAVRDPANALNRPLDVRFVLDQLTKLNKEDPGFKGKLDLEKVGMAGHSFGAFTTQAVVGQVFVLPGGKEAQMRDGRVKAAISISPNPPPARTKPEVAFAKVAVPVLHLTGTRDDGVGITETKAVDRRVPFDHIRGADGYLVTFKDGDHMVFAGPPRRVGEGKNDKAIQELTRAASTAFWKAYLAGDDAARAWLAEGGFRKALGEQGTFERK